MSNSIKALVLVLALVLGFAGGYLYFQPNATVGGGGGTTYNASHFVGDVYNGVSDTKMMSGGVLVAPISATTAAFSSTASITGELTLGSATATSTVALQYFCMEYYATSSATVLNMTASSTAPTGSAPLVSSYGACP